MLRTSAAGGAHSIAPKGVTQWATARRLVKMGLGTIGEDRRFTASARGVAAVAPPQDSQQ